MATRVASFSAKVTSVGPVTAGSSSVTLITSMVTAMSVELSESVAVTVTS